MQLHFDKFLDVLFKDISERIISLFLSMLVFFGLDKFVKIPLMMHNIITHEIITGFIKMFFSVATGVILYLALEFVKSKRKKKTDEDSK